jgi:hypothetical protein
MFVVPDPRNSNLVYSGYQFGNYDRIEVDKGKFVSITPAHDIGEAPLRWNWRTPLIMSKHNPDILYIGSQRVYRTLNQGDDWQAISGDLSKNKPQGNVAFSTITSLAESPLKFGLLYAGTDDGNVWVSKNGGENWEQINAGLPADKWVSSLFPSPHDVATVFISLNGYRDDDFKTYLYMSTDYGKTWKSVKGNLPESVANVIIQDPVNADLLYGGLDVGTFVSLDKGNTWNFFNQMLNVPSYDMLVHPRDNELVVGTHGRSVFVADVKPLQALRNGEASKSIVAFAPESIRHHERWGEKQYGWSKPFEPKATVHYYVGKASAQVAVQLIDEKKNVVRTAVASAESGFHTWVWDLKIEEATAGKSKSKQPVAKALRYASKGKYKIRFVNGTDSSEVEVEIK